MNLSSFLSRIQHKANHREKPKTPTSLNKINLNFTENITKEANSLKNNHLL